MKEPTVSYSLAVALKAAGFDVLDSDKAYYIHSWMQEPKLVSLEDAMFEESQYDGTDIYSAPRLDQAQRWLREVKGIAVNVIAHDGGKWEYEIVFLPNFEETYDSFNIDRSPWCKTYEEALTEGIEEALKILNENKQ